MRHPVLVEDIIRLRLAEAFRPSWEKIWVSIGFAYVFGWFVGPSLYDFFKMYPIAILISYLLAWPQFVTKDFVGRYFSYRSPFPWYNPALLLLWFYYYALFSVGIYLRHLRKKD